ncbi:MAG: hypothetical protein P4L84_29920 [Isosphaeraceae bacterium]|nr:hypothetical protein [Isosphaeraceae bacterium]
MRRFMHLGIVMSVALMARPALAGSIVDPTAAIQRTSLGGGDFDYKVTLTNSAASSAPIGTFWFSWVPGKDFLDNAPLSVTSPTGWTDRVTHGGATDGYAIQWVASTAGLLAPGNSATFEFTSTETPSQLMGNSPFYAAFPEGTAFVYSGAPFSDAGVQFVASAVPEPSSLALSLISMSGLTMIAYKRNHRRRRA